MPEGDIEQDSLVVPEKSKSMESVPQVQASSSACPIEICDDSNDEKSVTKPTEGPADVRIFSKDASRMTQHHGKRSCFQSAKDNTEGKASQRNRVDDARMQHNLQASSPPRQSLEPADEGLDSISRALHASGASARRKEIDHEISTPLHSGRTQDRTHNSTPGHIAVPTSPGRSAVREVEPYGSDVDSSLDSPEVKGGINKEFGVSASIGHDQPTRGVFVREVESVAAASGTRVRRSSYHLQGSEIVANITHSGNLGASNTSDSSLSKENPTAQEDLAAAHRADKQPHAVLLGEGESSTATDDLEVMLPRLQNNGFGSMITSGCSEHCEAINLPSATIPATLLPAEVGTVSASPVDADCVASAPSCIADPAGDIDLPSPQICDTLNLHETDIKESASMLSSRSASPKVNSLSKKSIATKLTSVPSSCEAASLPEEDNNMNTAVDSQPGSQTSCDSTSDAQSKHSDASSSTHVQKSALQQEYFGVLGGDGACDEGYASQQPLVLDKGTAPSLQHKVPSMGLAKSERAFRIGKALYNLIAGTTGQPLLISSDVDEAVHEYKALHLYLKDEELPLVHSAVHQSLSLFGDELWVAVSKDPLVWLKIAIKMEHRALFEESIIHIVGLHGVKQPSWSSTLERFRCSLGPTTSRYIDKKIASLNLALHEINEELYTMTLEIDGKRFTNLNSDGDDRLHLAREVVNHFRQWMVSHWRGKANDSGLYRMLYAGGDSYLPTDEVLRYFRALIKDDAERAEVIAADLRELKNAAYDLVSAICVNRSRLCMDTHPLNYVTSTRVLREELPWPIYGQPDEETDSSSEDTTNR